MTDSPEERVFLVVVDQTEEHHVALRFACRRAVHTGGRVALMYVIEPGDFQHWMAVEDLMKQERREEAEASLQSYSEKVQAWTGKMPMLYIREGSPSEELFALIDEEPNISILVLAADTSQSGPGPLVEALVGKMSGRLRIPFTIVPGSLDDGQIDSLT